MPGFYEHEEAAHHIEAEGNSEDDQTGELDTETEKPRERPRPPISAPPRPSSSSTKLEDVPQRHIISRPKPLGRERSKSDVGQRPKQLQSGGNEAQVCPICSQTLTTDNQGLNAHIDFCLSRSAIQEARGGGTGDGRLQKAVSMKPSSTSTTKGWDFLMAQKDTQSRPKSRKRK